MDLSKLRVSIVNDPAMLQKGVGKRQYYVCRCLIPFREQLKLVAYKLKGYLKPLP
jgi:hypothetical protein